MKLILFLLVLFLSFFVAYDFFADITQEVIIKNKESSWAPMAQNVFAAVSYYTRQHRVAREAYGMQLRLFPNDDLNSKSLYRMAKSSERLGDYERAAKFYHKFLDAFPHHKKVENVKMSLKNTEEVYLEFVR